MTCLKSTILCIAVIMVASGMYCLLGLALFGQAESGGTYVSYLVVDLAMDAIPGVTLMCIQRIITGKYQPWLGVWLTVFFVVSEQLGNGLLHSLLPRSWRIK